MLIDIANSGAVWANSGLDLTAEVIRASTPAAEDGAGQEVGSRSGFRVHGQVQFGFVIRFTVQLNPEP